MRAYRWRSEARRSSRRSPYIHAEAYPSSELKHGPLALISPELPTFIVIPDDELFDKNVATIREIQTARAGRYLLEPCLDAVTSGAARRRRGRCGWRCWSPTAPAHPPEPRVIATAFHSAVSLLADRPRSWSSIDDVQWLDPPSEEAVEFAARRLEHEAVGLLCAQRRHPATDCRWDWTVPCCALTSCRSAA